MRDELVRGVCGRLETLTRRMIRGFPKVQRWSDSEDVLQGALLRLLRSLESVEIVSTCDFFALSTTHIRRELLDMRGDSTDRRDTLQVIRAVARLAAWSRPPRAMPTPTL